jgi:hypothetical protein
MYTVYCLLNRNQLRQVTGHCHLQGLLFEMDLANNLTRGKCHNKKEIKILSLGCLLYELSQGTIKQNTALCIKHGTAGG